MLLFKNKMCFRVGGSSQQGVPVGGIDEMVRATNSVVIKVGIIQLLFQDESSTLKPLYLFVCFVDLWYSC